MMDYEWGNPSTIMLTGDGEPAQDSGQTPLNIFDHYSDQTFSHNLINPNQNGLNNHPNHNHFHHPLTQNTHFQSLYDPRTYGASHAPPGVETISLEPVHSGPTEYVIVPKSEPAGIDYTSRIGLNLGGRTYFSSSENDFVDRLYRRSIAHEPGSLNSPRCQAEGCNADLTHAKHYHRRHKVCEFHSKASTVIAGGLTQRFCQQCSRFHLLPEFDKAKRSCRRRLTDHNRRRRKNQQTNQAADRNKSWLQNAHNYSSSENQLTRSPPDSGVKSSSSVIMAISPPGINSLGSSRQRSYEAPSSSLSTSSLFFSNG